ncbi:MAG: anti-sigma factor [Pyrinomonadaceae bacterium]
MNRNPLIETDAGLVPAVILSGFVIAQEIGRPTNEFEIDFSGCLDGLKGKAVVSPRLDGTTRIVMRFDGMRNTPEGKRYVLWALEPNGRYHKLGQVVNTGERQRAEIHCEVFLRDFNLFITVEDEDIDVPTGPVFSVFSV